MPTLTYPFGPFLDPCHADAHDVAAVRGRVTGHHPGTHERLEQQPTRCTTQTHKKTQETHTYKKTQKLMKRGLRSPDSARMDESSPALFLQVEAPTSDVEVGGECGPRHATQQPGLRVEHQCGHEGQHQVPALQRPHAAAQHRHARLHMPQHTCVRSSSIRVLDGIVKCVCRSSTSGGCCVKKRFV
jgi:hypothetical protein